MRPERASDLLARAVGRRIVVVGDVFVDRYVVGQPERLSREGPVPVLSLRRTFDRAGGAANPACNLAALGAAVVQVGVVGADEEATALRRALSDAGIDASGLVVDPARPTTLKTRVVAEGLGAPHQIARVDRQSRESVAGEVADAVVDAVVRAAATADAVLVSHYRSGVATPVVCAAARAAVARDGWLTVDAQGDLERFAGFDLVRIGGQDAEAVLGSSLSTDDHYRRATEDLRRSLGARVVIVGRGAEGMSVADELGYAVVRPANVSEVFDVAGAGDTVIAVATLALAAGATVRESVHLANLAAGIAVRRLGVAAPTAAEILAEATAAGDRGAV